MARKANTSPQTLKLLDALVSRPEEWRHGYDLGKETGLKSGTLYPQLMRLEASGWLEAKWEEAPMPGKPARHLYRLTALGLAEAPLLLRATQSAVLDALRAIEGSSS